MAKAFKCDICGGFYSEYTKGIITGDKECTIIQVMKRYEREPLDICPTCLIERLVTSISVLNSLLIKSTT